LVGAWVPALGVKIKHSNGRVTMLDLSGNGQHFTSASNPVGQHNWVVKGGPAFEFTSNNDWQLVTSNLDRIVAARNVTTVLQYQKTDAVNRAAGVFGTNASSGARAYGAYLPSSDGVAYFRFGGDSGDNALAVSGLSFGNDTWVFRGGDLGIQMWQNGVLVGSKSTAISRDASHAGLQNQLNIGKFGTPFTDRAIYRVFLVYSRNLSEQEVQLLSRDPLAPFRLPVSLAAAPVGPGGSDLERSVSQTLNLTDGAIANWDKLFSVGTTLSLNDSGGYSQGLLIEDEIAFADTAADFLFPGNVHSCADDLGLTDSVDGDNANVDGGSNNLNLTDSVTFIGPRYVSVHTTLGLQQTAQGSLGVPWVPFEIEHSLGLTQIAGRGIPLAVSNAITLVQQAYRLLPVTTTLSFVQTVIGGKGQDTPEDGLNLSHSVVVNGSFLRDATHGNILSHSLTYFIDGPCARKQYNRFQGEGDGAGIDERPLLFSSDFVLESLTGAKQTVRLRSPEMDDRDRLGFTRVNRETRGGELNIYSDPAWPKINTLLVTLTALKQDKVEELQDFMLDTLGQQIKLHDWKGRCWIGVITTPGDVATEDDRNAWTVSFEFEGEPYAGQAIDDRLAFEQSVLPIGPVDEDADPGALSLDHYVTVTVESP